MRFNGAASESKLYQSAFLVSTIEFFGLIKIRRVVDIYLYYKNIITRTTTIDVDYFKR